MKTLKNLLVILSLLALLAACAPASTPAASQGGIEVDQAVIRLPGGSMADMNMSDDTSLAGYMRITNNGASDDSLVGIQADFAGSSMLHQSSVDSNGVATMKMVMAIDIPAGQTVELKPGGFHAMFNNLKGNLKLGDMVMLTLKFKNAGDIQVQAQVTDTDQ